MMRASEYGVRARGRERAAGGWRARTLKVRSALKHVERMNEVHEMRHHDAMSVWASL